jgi:hypothetical protein
VASKAKNQDIKQPQLEKTTWEAAHEENPAPDPEGPLTK